MPTLAVWFIGDAYSERKITHSDWAIFGINADTVSWSAVNGWSIPHSLFSSDQLALLSTQSDFLLGQEGPRLHRTPDLGNDPLLSAYVYAERVKQMYDILIDTGVLTPDQIQDLIDESFNTKANVESPDFTGTPTIAGDVIPAVKDIASNSVTTTLTFADYNTFLFYGSTAGQTLVMPPVASIGSDDNPRTIINIATVAVNIQADAGDGNVLFDNMNMARHVITLDPGESVALITDGGSYFVVGRTTMKASRFVGRDVGGSTGAEDGANAWVRIAKISIPAPYNDVTATLLVSSASTGGMDAAVISAFFRTNGEPDAVTIDVQMHSKVGPYGSIGDDSFKVIAGAYADNKFELWFQKKQPYCQFTVYELGVSHTDYASILYDNNQYWQAAEPVGTVLNRKTSGVGIAGNLYVSGIAGFASDVYVNGNALRGSAAFVARRSQYINAASSIVIGDVYSDYFIALGSSAVITMEAASVAATNFIQVTYCNLSTSTLTLTAHSGDLIYDGTLDAVSHTTFSLGPLKTATFFASGNAWFRV